MNSRKEREESIPDCGPERQRSARLHRLRALELEKNAITLRGSGLTRDFSKGQAKQAKEAMIYLLAGPETERVQRAYVRAHGSSFNDPHSYLHMVQWHRARDDKKKH